jgi:hypothetical protein
MRRVSALGLVETAAITAMASFATLAVSHLPVTFGAGASSPPKPMMRLGLQGTAAQSYTTPTSARRLRFRSPLWTVGSLAQELETLTIEVIRGDPASSRVLDYSLCRSRRQCDPLCVNLG